MIAFAHIEQSKGTFLEAELQIAELQTCMLSGLRVQETKKTHLYEFIPDLFQPDIQIRSRFRPLHIVSHDWRPP